MGSISKHQNRGLSWIRAIGPAVLSLLVPAAVAAQSDPNLGAPARVGFEIDKSGDVLVISKIIAGTSAEDAGLKIGDQVLRVDQLNVIDMSVRKVEPMLRGPRGTAVTVTVLPRMEMLPRTVTLQRDSDDDSPVEGASGSAADAIKRMAKASREARKARTALVIEHVDFVSKGQPEQALRDALAARVKDVDQCVHAVPGFPTTDDGHFDVRYSLKGSGYLGVRVEPIDADVQVCIAAKAAHWTLPAPHEPPAELVARYSVVTEGDAPPPSPGKKSSP